jgi:hypothetical protein
VGEVIHLRFTDYTPDKAAFMLKCARSFAVSKLEGKTGARAGTVYRRGELCFLAYWTGTRAVVVKEVHRG